MRITDWSRRPLTPEQEKYALHDVIELKTVYQKMMEDICTHNRLDWIQEEMMILTNPKNYQINILHLMEKIHMPFHKKETVHLCARLLGWREKMAQQKNRPRKYILSDDTLLECSAIAPQTETELEALRSISEGFSKSDLGKSLIKVIQKTATEDILEWAIPEKQNVSNGNKSWMEALRLLLEAVCEEQNVAPYLVAPTDDLIQFIRSGEARFMKGWRFQIFGKFVEAFKKGEVALVYDMAYIIY